MAPMVHGLEAEYYGRVKFSYLERDDPGNQDLIRQLGIAYQPEFYLVDSNGVVLERMVGFVSEETFRTLFATYLQ